ncbi:MAG TPA: tRNA 2-selenouridine(34) synthase MnmH [Ignavibacteria bacterium]|nr:tRNA 2-selenouridine(34) synthase MnmH [Ignavibacteria bacterium]
MQDIQNLNTEKELFDFIRKSDCSNVPPLKSIFSNYKFTKISITDALDHIKLNEAIVIDARSEKEFNESALPSAVNFPVLRNQERHNVGLIYKNYSQSAAVWLAMKYANPKSESLSDFLNECKSTVKNIIVYCWRGGGRSSYLAKMLEDILTQNPEANLYTIAGGFKAYRRHVIDFFKTEINDYNFIEITGLTGNNKSRLIESISTKIDALDLEFCARHQSSLFGQIPYHIRGFEPVKNQSAFENNIFNQLLFLKEKNNILVESESKKIGDFFIPDTLYAKLENAPSIQLIASLETRVNTITEDYFGKDLKGLPLVKEIFVKKSGFFKQQLSKQVYEELLEYLENGEVKKFSEIMLVKYYDKRYKEKGKKPVLRVNSDNLGIAEQEILNYIKILTE